LLIEQEEEEEENEEKLVEALAEFE